MGGDTVMQHGCNQHWHIENLIKKHMEQAYILQRLKEMTLAELLDALAEAHAGKRIDIYEVLDPKLIDTTIDAVWAFIESVQQLKKF
jgi:hypothetical protein